LGTGTAGAARAAVRASTSAVFQASRSTCQVPSQIINKTAGIVNKVGQRVKRNRSLKKPIACLLRAATKLVQPDCRAISPALSSP
jgi:hypothetical protein